MAKVIKIRAPKSLQLHTMKGKEIEALVSKLADQALEHLPKEARPVGINAVAIGQILKGTQSAPGDTWREWTRACCNRRDLIAEFVNPVIEEFETTGAPVAAELAGKHVESQLRIIELENPNMHR